MKKFSYFLAALFSVFLIAGCSSESLPEQFAKEMENQAKYNAGTFSLKLDDLEVPTTEDADSAEVGQMNAMLSMIKGAKVSGDYLTDEKGEKAAITLNLEGMGQKIPLEMLVDVKKQDVYINGDIYATIMNLIGTMGDAGAVDTAEADKYKGKYILVSSEEMEKQAGQVGQADKTKQFQELQNMNGNKSFQEYAKTLDPDSFKKEGDKLSHTYTKKELQGYLDYVKEKGTKDEKEAVKSLSDTMKDLDKFSMKYTIDTKTAKQDIDVTTTITQEGQSATVKMSIDTQGKEAKEAVKLPTKEQTVALEELLPSAPTGEDGEEMTLTDEEFQEVVAELEKSKAEMTDEEKQTLLDIYGSLLTEEQLKKVEEILGTTDKSL